MCADLVYDEYEEEEKYDQDFAAFFLCKHVTEPTHPHNRINHHPTNLMR